MSKKLLNTEISVIAETAFTHEGDYSYLESQINLAAELGCEYVKFQILINLDSVYSKETAIYNDIKTKLISSETWFKAFNLAKVKGLKTVVLPVDYDGLDLALKNPDLVDAIEVHSICLNDIVFLDKLNSQWNSKQIILGIGGRNLSDITFAVEYLSNQNILLMFGYQSFPTKKTDNNLSKILSLKAKFNYPIGFADHTPWDESDSDVIQIALALGCEIIEKHIILKAGDNRADLYSAKDKVGFLELFSTIKNFKLILGNPNLNTLSFKETVYKNRERKIVVTEDISEGTKITKNVLGYSVTDQLTDIEQKAFSDLDGTIAKSDIKKGTVITTKNVK